MSSELMKKLEGLCSGLLWSSESDYPFEIKEFEGTITESRLLQLFGCPADAQVETRDFEEFFSWVTTEQDWHGEVEKEICSRYQELVNFLKSNFQQLRVYRVYGEPNLIDVFIVGDRGENSIILQTKAVET